MPGDLAATQPFDWRASDLFGECGFAAAARVSHNHCDCQRVDEGKSLWLSQAWTPA